jgi:formylglycine-generating enzyme required for sulfatase activity
MQSFRGGDSPDPNLANYPYAKIGSTSAVGCFPANAFGLHDIIGNVMEWTSSQYKPYPYRAQDGRENQRASDEKDRVLRGGSYSWSPDGARCARRYRYLPGTRSTDSGFRVVLRSVPIS